ncbi:MAG: hypothetical protein JST80_07400 [Bdellovibrionales bacterium]|nr:hypothetical protein [Bdellovibrionales bacterium]
MIALGVLIVYALYELFVSTGVVRMSLGLFRLVTVVSLVLLVCARRTEVYVGSALLFGVISLVCIWSFRSEVQSDDRS